LIALLTGAPIALGVHSMAALLRVKSTLLSGGIANSALSVGEDAGTVGGVALAVLAPLILAIILAIALAIALAWTAARFRRRSLRTASPPPRA
jgi:membrane protein implicated in regulation of membrane protease activity